MFFWGPAVVLAARAHGQSHCGTWSIAHRGNSIVAPENTVAAIEATAGVAHLVEFDVRQCATGELVVVHDATVDRTTDGSGNVAELSLAELQALDAGGWFSPAFSGERIPTLAEALAAVPPGVTPLIHHYTGSASALVAELDTLGLQHDVVIQSFDWEFLSAVHALNPAIRLGALGTGPLTGQRLADAQTSGVEFVAWLGREVDAAAMQLVRDVGLALYVWTVNDSATIDGFVAIGVDGIISDDPALVFDMSDAWHIGADFDKDGDVDLEDHRHFADCAAGPGVETQPEGCRFFDSDCDGDVDLHDFGTFTSTYQSLRINRVRESHSVE